MDRILLKVVNPNVDVDVTYVNFAYKHLNGFTSTSTFTSTFGLTTLSKTRPRSVISQIGLRGLH